MPGCRLSAGTFQFGVVRIAGHEQRIVLRSEPAAVLSRRLAAGCGRMIGDPRQHHERGHRAAGAAGASRAREPRCGVSLALGGVSSLLTTGARWPVTVAWPLDRCAGSSCVSERMTASLSVTPASSRKVLADLQAGHFRRDRLERPADVVRGVGLQIERVELARPAPHEQEDAALRLAEAGRVAMPNCWCSLRPDPAQSSAGRPRPSIPAVPAWTTVRRLNWWSARNSEQPRSGVGPDIRSIRGGRWGGTSAEHKRPPMRCPSYLSATRRESLKQTLLGCLYSVAMQ